MTFVDPLRLPEREPLPGWKGRFFHSEHMTFGYYDIDIHAVAVHEHHHEQEEVLNVIDGRLAVTIDGEERVVPAGSAAVIPANTMHSARAITACKVIVVDYPLRHQVGGVSTAAEP